MIVFCAFAKRVKLHIYIYIYIVNIYIYIYIYICMCGIFSTSTAVGKVMFFFCEGLGDVTGVPSYPIPVWGKWSWIWESP